MYNLNEIKNAKGLHLAHLNVRSLVNTWDNIKGNFIDSGLYILSFSETWLHDVLPNNLFEFGHNFTLLCNDRNRNDADNPLLQPKLGGGTCIYIRNELQFSELQYSHYNTSNKNLKSQRVSIYQKPNKTTLMGNLYKLPQGDSKKCLEILDNILADIDLTTIKVILMGDLNLDILDKNNLVPNKSDKCN